MYLGVSKDKTLEDEEVKNAVSAHAIEPMPDNPTRSCSVIQVHEEQVKMVVQLQVQA